MVVSGIVAAEAWPGARDYQEQVGAVDLRATTAVNLRARSDTPLEEFLR